LKPTYWNVFHHASREQWQAVPGLEGQVEALTLRADAATGVVTRLTRFLPGADTSVLGPKVHDFPEDVLIVSGRLHDKAADQWLEAGHVACRPPGEVHGPFRTDIGCVVLDLAFAGQRATTCQEQA
jgi:ChrR Cupin-like domain